MMNPAPYPVLNSITDNSLIGDERAFFGAKLEKDTKSEGFCHATFAEDGDVVLIRAYVENSAADNFAGADGTGPGIARDVRLSITQDTEIASLRRVRATLTAANTSPRSIWDGLEIAAPKPFRLDIVSGSGILISNAHPEGIALPDALWKDERGVQLGYERPDGVFVPGYKYDNLVGLKARVTYVVG